MQTHKFASLRFEAEKSHWKKFFDEISFNYFGVRYANIDDLTKAMSKNLTQFDPEVCNKLFCLLEEKDSKMISDD